jgi:hypothetical protein
MQKMSILKSSTGDQIHYVDFHNTLYNWPLTISMLKMYQKNSTCWKVKYLRILIFSFSLSFLFDKKTDPKNCYTKKLPTQFFSFTKNRKNFSTRKIAKPTFQKHKLCFLPRKKNAARNCDSERFPTVLFKLDLQILLHKRNNTWDDNRR